MRNYNHDELIVLFEKWKHFVKIRGLARGENRKKLDEIYNQALPLVSLVTEATPEMDITDLINQALDTIGGNMKQTKKDLEKRIKDLSDQVERVQGDILQYEIQIKNQDFEDPKFAVDNLEKLNNALTSRQSVLNVISGQLKLAERDLALAVETERVQKIAELKKAENKLIIEVIKALSMVQVVFDELEDIQTQIGALKGSANIHPPLNNLKKTINLTLRNLHDFKPEFFGGVARITQQRKEQQAQSNGRENQRLAKIEEREAYIQAKKNERLAEANGIAAYQARVKAQREELQKVGQP